MGSGIDDFASLVGAVSGASGSSPSFAISQNLESGIEEQFSWEMIGLGLEEPLPPQETINEL